MRAAVLALILLSGCRPADEQRDEATVRPIHGDPENFTASGFPKRSYSIPNCRFEISLRPPFEVSEDSWGQALIRAPLALLTDASVKDVAEGGVDHQKRVSYAFPSLYGGEGLKESFTSRRIKLAPPRPLENAPSTLGTEETLKGDGTRGETRYLGLLQDGRETALLCTATDWPNPSCQAEVPIGASGERYLIIFPPKAINRLTRMVQIGDALFSEAARHCKLRRSA